MADFVHLHLHSEYSLLDGACRVADIPKKAKAEGHRAVAITDHGVMYGAVAFYRACQEESIKPIIGCEVYVAPRTRHDREGRMDSSSHHLVLLVENEVGYRNLIALVSAGFVEGFYSKPRVDMELLRKHSKGLIALSACLAGKIPQLILGGDQHGAVAYAKELHEIFGKDHFYLEVQDHALAEEQTVARALREIAAETGIGLVATNDVHYLEKKDADTQAILMCVQTGNVITEGRPIGFETDEFYYKSTEEMAHLFADYPGALENSVKIAGMCNFDFIFGQTHLPTFTPPAGKTHKECLFSLAEEGFSEKVRRGEIDFTFATETQYRERMNYELSVIDQMGFNAYFLIVQDFIAFAKRSDIPVGPGRGSGAGSLVAYCVGITDVDPLRYQLLFERFLNPERVSLPDFDTDFCYDRRGEVIEYVRHKYGEDHVAQIVTFGTLAARAAVRDVGRALGMPYAEVDRVARLIPHELNVTIADAMAKKELRDLYDGSPEIRRLLDTARALEGMPRHASTHAAGIVITEKPTDYYVPLSVNGDVTVTQYDMDTAAALGLVKFDFLGLRYLTILSNAEKEIRVRTPDFTLSRIPQDDAETFRLMAEGQTNGVFQLESAGMKQMLAQLKPANLEDVIAAIALYRPGPMDSIPRYIACRNGTEQVSYAVPALRDILGVTNGCIVYQEQVMQICRELAGYSFAHADIVRRAMSKKKAEVMEAERAQFVAGSVARGVDQAAAEQIFEEMVSFASYAFNKSHATAYAVISYRTAYLKVHYPREYMAALMTSVLGDTAKLGEYIAECQHAHIAVLAPDINESRLHFSVAGDHIRFGLLAIKNVGRTFVEQILRERQNGDFVDFEDFIDRMAGGDLNRRQVEALIKCGAFDRLGNKRSQLLSAYEQILESAAARVRTNLTGQLDLFSIGTVDAVAKTKFNYPDLPEFNIRELLLLEKESAGMSFSGHLLDDYKKHIAYLKAEPIGDIMSSYSEETGESDRYADKQRVGVAGIITKRVNKNTRGGEPMAFFTLADRFSEMEVVVFPKLLARFGTEVRVENVVYAEGELSIREGEEPKLLLGSLVPLKADEDFVPSASSKSTEVPKKVGKLYLKVPSLSDAVCETALSLVKKIGGNVPVIFYDNSQRKYVAAKDVQTTADDALLSRLRVLLGEENVILQ
ncbi:MAG: DNA polymerase III subunit alpha [Clostridia bacterium]|nr:DNA polymerase III subunit alpha [Clostridia bacterium]